MSNISLQIECTNPTTLVPNSNIIFDKEIYISGNINYSTSSGSITFNESGTYIINWWINVKSTIGTNVVTFALVTSTGDIFEGSSISKTGQISGSAIINVVNPTLSVSLKNTTLGSISLASNSTTTASLIAIQYNKVPPIGLSETSLCFSYLQFANILTQIIEKYPTNSLSVFTTGFNPNIIDGTAVKVYSSNLSSNIGLFIINSGGTEIAIPLNSLIAIYVGDDAIYDDSIIFIPPPNPLPAGCDTDIFTSLKDYITLGSTLYFTIGVNLSGNGTVYKNEYGMLVLTNPDGSSPLFVNPSKICTIYT